MLYLVVALIAVGALTVDQITKYLVVTFLSPEGSSVGVIPGAFNFTYVRNGNGMMGLFRENRWVFVLLSLVVVGAIVFYFWKFRPKNRLLCISLGMVLGGGLGNMVDRVFHADGKVIDFIDFCAFPNVWKYIYNVADIFVTVGAAFLLLYLIFDTVKEYKNAKAKEVSGTAAESSDTNAVGERDTFSDGTAGADVHPDGGQSRGGDED